MVEESDVKAFENISLNSSTSSLDKENVNIVFVGHVDAGKSTIGGQIMYLSGMVDKRTLEKYEKEAKELNRESWYLSWALDTSNEERAKGITVECGRGYFETPNRRVTILDAPGHKNFVPSMISGATQADVAILVVSARKGEFETGFEKGGQTREHATLVKTLGIKRLVVAINKMDDSTVLWSKARYDEIIEKLTPFLKNNGYNIQKEVTFIPISGFTGLNIKDQVPKTVCPWIENTQSLLSYLDSMPSFERKVDGPLIMQITGKCKDMGTMADGKIESGRLSKGDNVLIMPTKKESEILNIYIEDSDVQTAKAGENCRVKLKGVEEDEISTGYIICDPKNPIKAATTFVAQIHLRELRNIIAPGFKAVMHIHSASEEISINSIKDEIDKKTNLRVKKKVPFAKSGEIVFAEIESQHPVCIDTYANCSALARFSLRDEGKTIAVGKILEIIDK